MSKRKRREQQHLRQQPARRTSYTVGGSAPAQKYKPGFPMNLLGNIKFFSIVGVIVAIVMVGSAIFSATQNNNNNVDLPATATPTATASASPEGTVTPTGSETPSGTQTPAATATPDPKQFSKAEQVIDAEKSKYAATIKTARGDIVIELFADKAPRTVNNFVFLAQKKYFDGITFHRVVATSIFVAQSGDPTGKGTGGPGYLTQEDSNDLLNKKGMISMAKAGAVTNFGSQFFINVRDNPGLDTDTPNQKRFYPFAQVTSGMDVVEKIAQGDIIQSVTITESPK